MKTFAAVFSFFLYGSILAELNPWLLLLLVGLSMVHFLALRRAQKHEVDRILERSGIQHGRWYFRTKASDVNLGKDLRLYEMAGWIRGYFHHYRDAHFRLRQDVQNHFYQAALDPIAESETYEQFHQLSGDKTAVYISHRLASTRFCSRVVLLENGQVRASGTHEELLRSCPAYAEMFRVQSRYYRKEEEAVL